MPIPTLLPGEFAIRTLYSYNFLSGAYDPNSGTGTVITSATSLTPTEKFKITSWFPGFSLIQTLLDQQYVTVAPQGGLELSGSLDTENSLFTLIGPQQGLGNFLITIYDGSFLIAVDGGGQTSNAFLTEQPTSQFAYDVSFFIVKSGDLGNGYRYAIRAAPSQVQRAPVSDSQFTNFLTARGGGNQTTNAVTAAGKFLTSDGIFTLIRMDAEKGTYALQTSDGYNFVTAVDGGGLASGDNLHTDATRPNAWETFQIVDQFDGTYTIQTVSGFYLAVGPGGPGKDISTRISSPDLAPEIGYNAKFEFIMLPNQLEITGLT